MNENKKLSLIAIAIILAGLIYTEFTVFLNWGPMVNAAIEADESIDPGSMTFFAINYFFDCIRNFWYFNIF